MAVRCRDCVGRLLMACRGDLCRTERLCLIEEVNRRAIQLRHHLSDFVKVKGHPVWRAECSRCGRAALITIDPEPGQPMVHGEATVVACRGFNGDG